MKKSAKGRLFRITKRKVLINGREGTQGREQFVLDLSRKEVVDGIYEQISTVIRSTDISYVKWDMNRQLTDVARAGTSGRYLPSFRENGVYDCWMSTSKDKKEALVTFVQVLTKPNQKSFYIRLQNIAWREASRYTEEVF